MTGYNVMTDPSATGEEKLRWCCEGITAQNRALMSRLAMPDFNPGTELDNTRNSAMYRICNLFEVFTLFDQGKVPTELTDRMVETTDQLVDAVSARYGHLGDVRRLCKEAGLAFRHSKRIWRIRTTAMPLPREEYHARLEQCKNEILTALDELNIELDRVVPFPGTPAAATQQPIVPGAACRDFVLSCNPATREIVIDALTDKRMRAVTTCKITDDLAWDVAVQLVTAERYPIVIENPRRHGKLDLAKMFRVNRHDNRNVFYGFIHTSKIGMNAAYELRRTRRMKRQGKMRAKRS